MSKLVIGRYILGSSWAGLVFCEEVSVRNGGARFESIDSSSDSTAVSLSLACNFFYQFITAVYLDQSCGHPVGYFCKLLPYKYSELL